MDALMQQFDEYCAKNRISCIARVTHRDKIRFQHDFGYADLSQKQPFSAATVFPFYSLSKPFCAIGALILKDRGLLELDRHPSAYLPEAAGLHPEVTLRQLLQHTSGLPDFYQCADFARRYAPGTPDRLREHVRLLSAYPQFFEPGTAGKYANVNFVLLALIIENVTGLSYRDYMRQAVFTPLGMETAAVADRDTPNPLRATGYALQDGIPCPVPRNCDWMLGAGDIEGTLDDVYCLNKAIKHRLLLTGDTWSQVLTGSPINSMGFGCRVDLWHGRKRILHNGGHTGFRTYHIQLPEEDFDLILLSNSGYGSAREDLSELIFRHFYRTGPEQTQKIELDQGYI